MENLCATDNTTLKSCTLESCTPILHPIVIGAPETSISLDSETTSLSDSESENESPRDVLPFSSPGHHGMGPISTINVQGSSDVVIGPMTQFHGPVTIYQRVTSNTQNHNGLSLENSKSEDGGDNVTKVQLGDKFSPISKSQDSQIKKSRKIPSWSYVVILVAVAAAVGIGVYFGTNYGTKPPYNYNPPNIGGAILNFTHRMYTRELWGGVPPKFPAKSLVHPTKYVMISHTAGPFCNAFKRCSELVRNIQAYHMGELESSDIGENFLIGNDGGIFIGRSWDVRNIHDHSTIGISMIGNFVTRDFMTPEMVTILKDLLSLGVYSEKLDPDYRLICHNQTYPTQSPGKNVCNKIAQFPNYWPGPVTIE